MIEKYLSRKIRVEIRHILMAEWDPIDVGDEPTAADEYDGYIGPIFEFLEKCAPGSEIVEYLRWVEVVRMGLIDAECQPLRPLANRQKTAALLQDLWTRSVVIS